jgi:mycothiol maleylpyruvate isomerase-like protein
VTWRVSVILAGSPWRDVRLTRSGVCLATATSDTRQPGPGLTPTLTGVMTAFEGIVDRFISSSSAFGQKLAAMRPGQWSWPTPCAEWNVRQLVNHMTQGNLNYVRLLDGATSAEFLRLRDSDALGADPPGTYARSMRECAAAFPRPGALEQVLDYPLGQVTGQQALAVRTTDTIIHT